MPTTRLKIFISSVQSEFAKVRADLKTFLLGDSFLRRFVAGVFLFEDLPATDRRADELYLDEVQRCDIYIGLFGEKYGSLDENGVSPTEHEYDCATQHRKTRLIFVWGSGTSRDPKMEALIQKASGHVVWRPIEEATALNAEVYTSIIDELDRRGALLVPPFDKSPCEGAKLSALSRKRIDWFIEKANMERGFALGAKTATKSLLVHLNLMQGQAPTNAAVLLFGSNPQSFHSAAEIKCVQCAGSEYTRPFLSQQIYKGDLFDQADRALEFVLSRVDRAVGTRATSIAAPATIELPPDAVAEAIVNAIAHRDYNSNAAVEVRLFSDRLEVWNPGRLPGSWTAETLREDHASVPNNPLIAEPMYQTRYIEKAGTGTQKIVELCRRQGLPEPDFEQRQGSFVVTIWRDWLTAEVINRLDLNDRQRQAVAYLKVHRSITNTEYQTEIGVSKRTASRDLEELQSRDVVEKIGTTGKGVRYILSKGAIKGPKGPAAETGQKRAKRARKK